MAIDDLLDEHEQGERVRTWIRRNGASVIGGVVLGLSAIGGGQWYLKHRADHRAQAGADYQSALQALQADGAKAAPKVAALRGTPYGGLAALALAGVQADAGQRDAAIATLRGAPRDQAGVAAVIDQRLARLLIDAGKSQDAISLLADASAAGALEVRGDAELAAGRRDAARATYRKALLGAEVGSPQRNLLELKLSDVGGTADIPRTTEAGT